MRKDEQGNECPETLGEYLDACLAWGGPNTLAATMLAAEIARAGPEHKVQLTDAQMRAALMPLMKQTPDAGEEGNTMSEQVPDSTGTIVNKDHKKKVANYRTTVSYLKLVAENQVEPMKEEIRDIARKL
jgi:hypothetical protein